MEERWSSLGELRVSGSWGKQKSQQVVDEGAGVLGKALCMILGKAILMKSKGSFACSEFMLSKSNGKIRLITHISFSKIFDYSH